MQFSYSRVSTFKSCPHQFKLRYIDELTTLPTDDPSNALIVGSALHKGIETDVNTAIEEYYSSYPMITDNHINEALKLEYWIPKVKELVPNGEHEVLIEDVNFKGFIDLLVPVDVLDGVEIYDIYDFKYSNNVKNYLDSGQLHLYKYYFEKLNPGKKVRNLYFLFIPKSSLKIKYKNKTNPRDETIQEFRKRTLKDLESKEIQKVKIPYDANKVIEFLENIKAVIESTEYPKNETRLCDWCEFKEYCQNNEDYNIIYPDDASNRN